MTSRKLIICLLASMVMRNPLLLKMRHISFLMSLGVALVIAPKHVNSWGAFSSPNSRILI